MSGVVIVGLGLIGGSLGMALRARGLQVTGVDQASVIGTGAALAATTHQVDAADRGAVRAALEGADVAVLAMPVGGIEASVVEALELADVVTDCGSTKRGVAQAAAASPRASRFVPGHPMAGRPVGGIDNARPDLFAGHVWVLCGDACEPAALAKVEQLVRSVQAHPLRMTAEEHDRAVAVTSHLPQLVASALLLLAHDREAREVAGPAFERITRVAGGPEEMWKDIFSGNAAELASAARALCRALGVVADQLEQGDPSGAVELLARARALR